MENRKMKKQKRRNKNEEKEKDKKEKDHQKQNGFLSIPNIERTSAAVLGLT